MSYDVVLKGGTVIDGTGREGFAADVALSGDRIAAVEANIPSHEAVTSIDIGGLIVCPGFIDHHTHYDAQILWDPLATCSSWHGVTSIIMGNCGSVLLRASLPTGKPLWVIWSMLKVCPWRFCNAGLTGPGRASTNTSPPSAGVDWV